MRKFSLNGKVLSLVGVFVLTYLAVAAFAFTKVQQPNDRMLIVALSLAGIGGGLIFAYFVLRDVNQSVNRVIETLSKASEQVAAVSRQVATSSEQFSQATSQQAASLQESSAAIEEMSEMTQKNSENAEQTSQAAAASEASAKKGKEVVANMIHAIGEINTSNEQIMHQVNESNREVSEIVKVITEIGSKTKVINDIVFQTKLLSFNASVEAARAGEQGKGFAVVAEEVGNLAEMSGNAAKEISQLLDGSIQRVQSIVNRTKSNVETHMHEAKAKVQSGTQIAHQCGEVLDEIVGKVSTVSSLGSAIADASQAQAFGSREVAKAVHQLNEITTNNASASQGTAGAAAHLSSQATVLKESVQELIRAIRGSKPKVAPKAPKVPAKKRGPEKTVSKVLAHPLPSNVVPLTPRKADASPSKATASAPLPARSQGEMRMAVGSESVPVESDSRFEDV